MDVVNRANGWRKVITGNVLMMGLVSLFADTSSEMVFPLLPIFLTGLVPIGSAAIYVGLLEGIAESTASIMKIVAGRWSDAIGKRKPLAILGYGISTLCRPVMALALAGWHVIALRFVDRVGKGIRTSPRDALISDSIDSDMHGRAFSFHRAMDHTGAIIGSLLSLLILYLMLGYGMWKGSTEYVNPDEMRALRFLFAVSLVPGIFAMFAIVTKVKEIAPKKDSSGRYKSSHQNTANLPRRFYYFLIIVTLFALGNSSDLFLLFYGKTKFQFGLMQVILLWIGLHASKVVFSFLGGSLADRYGRRNTIVAGWIVYALVYLGLALVQSSLFFWILVLTYGIYYGLTEGAEKALVAEFSPSEYRGTAYGYYNGAIGIAALPASFLFGVFWAKIGSMFAFMVGASLAGLAAILLIIFLSTESR